MTSQRSHAFLVETNILMFVSKGFVYVLVSSQNIVYFPASSHIKRLQKRLGLVYPAMLVMLTKVL